ncbi:MAG: hypothetical protein ACKOWI_01400 [Rhodoluna sp.]
MTENEPDFVKRNRRKLSIGGGLLALVTVVFLGSLQFYSAESYAPRSLSEAMVGNEFIHPKPSARPDCAPFDCLESWTSDVGIFMRFSSDREAKYFAFVLGDRCRRNGSVIVDFGDLMLTTQQKMDAINILFPHKDWF